MYYQSLLFVLLLESRSEFEELLEFLQQAQLDRVGCFKYSPEESTAGGKMTDQIDEDIKEERFHRLMKLQLPISKKKHKGYKLNNRKIKSRQVGQYKGSN